MNIIKTDIPGVLVIEPRVVTDGRGYFMEDFNRKVFEENVGRIDFVQENESMSVRGVIRGLHFQRPPHAQAKLVRCVSGEVLDVALDLRKGSPTYGRHVAVKLSGDTRRQCFLPRGVAHGFAVLSPTAMFQYKCDNYYHPESEGGISIADGSLGIDWHINPDEAILSDKDRRHPLLKDFESPFIYEKQ